MAKFWYKYELDNDETIILEQGGRRKFYSKWIKNELGTSWIIGRCYLTNKRFTYLCVNRKPEYAFEITLDKIADVEIIRPPPLITLKPGFALTTNEGRYEEFFAGRLNDSKKWVNEISKRIW